MDVPVVLIKLREYLLWFGPVYLIAISLGAVSEVIMRRLLGLPSADAEVPQKGGPTARNPLTSINPNLVLLGWLRLAGRLDPSQRVPLQLYLWASLTAQSVSWVALLVTAQFGWALSLLMLGFALMMASLLATLAPLIIPGGRALSFEIAHAGDGSPAPKLHVEWWRAFQRRFNESSNGLILAAGLGALLFGLAPGIYSTFKVALAAPLSYLFGSAVGILGLFAPGTDAPLLAALQTRGGDSGAFIALMLAVPVSSWSLLRELKGVAGVRAAFTYLAAAWLLVAVMAWFFSFLLSTIGMS